MIDRLLQLRWPICAVLSDITTTKWDDRYLDLQPSSFDPLEQLRNVLHPLQVATTYLNGEFNVSVSAVLPVIHGIVNIMQPEENDSTAIRNFKHIVTRELKRWWNLDEIDPSEPSVPLLATLLDPRFKDTKFLNRSQKPLLKTSLIYLVNCHITSHSTNSTRELARSKSHRSTALDMLLGTDNSERCSVDSVTESVRTYLSDRMPSRESSPLQWRKMNSSQYNLLVPLVKRYLIVPATSTPSERIFSCAQLIANHLRSSLNPEHLNMLVFLNKNYKL